MDVLSHLSGLDELIQVIYQGFERFIILSTVNESSWTIYAGLKGPEGRWWRGSWSARDIIQFVGPKSSSEVLQSFAYNLSEAFVNGELCVGDWAPDRGVKINLTLGPALKKPVKVPLIELSAKEAASHATNVLSAIALQAQSRKCRLYPSSFSAQTVVTAGPSLTKPVSHVHPSKKVHAPEPAAPQIEDEAEVAQRKIKSLEAELAHVKAAKKVKSRSPSSEPEPKPSVATRPPKGASLANPHKKARKYQEVEFESDE